MSADILPSDATQTQMLSVGMVLSSGWNMSDSTNIQREMAATRPNQFRKRGMPGPQMGVVCMGAESG